MSGQDHWFGRSEAARVRETSGFKSVQGPDRYALNTAVHTPNNGNNSGVYSAAYNAARNHGLAEHGRKK